MKLIKIYILIYFFSFSSSGDYSTKPPKNLKHIKNIYSSWSNIESFNRPIITWDYIYYIQRGVLSAFNYNDIKIKLYIYIYKESTWDYELFWYIRYHLRYNFYPKCFLSIWR